MPTENRIMTLSGKRRTISFSDFALPFNGSTPPIGEFFLYGGCPYFRLNRFEVVEFPSFRARYEKYKFVDDKFPQYYPQLTE